MYLDDWNKNVFLKLKLECITFVTFFRATVCFKKLFTSFPVLTYIYIIVKPWHSLQQYKTSWETFQLEDTIFFIALKFTSKYQYTFSWVVKLRHKVNKFWIMWKFDLFFFTLALVIHKLLELKDILMWNIF